MGWIPTQIEHWSDQKHISFLIFIHPCAGDNYAVNEVLIKKSNARDILFSTFSLTLTILFDETNV